MEDTTLVAHFDNISEKIDGLKSAIDEIKEDSKIQYKSIVENSKDIEFIKEKFYEEKLETKDRFNIVHEKFRANQKNFKWGVMAMISLSAIISSTIQFFVSNSS